MEHLIHTTFHPLVAQLCEEYEPGDAGNQAVFNRSLKKLKLVIGEERIRNNISRIHQATGDNIHNIFPSKKEITEELIPIVDPLRLKFPGLQMGLSISSPVSLPQVPSLNLVIRLADMHQRVGIKIKIAVFLDEDGDVYYEVGYVDVSKSIHELKKNFIDQQPAKQDYFILQQLVSVTKQMIGRRPAVSGLDLTPAYYHVLPLCLRLGGLPVNPVHFPNWIDNLEKNIAFSLSEFKKNDPGTAAAFIMVPRRMLVSWLFENELLYHAGTNEKMDWQPPRLICKTG